MQGLYPPTPPYSPQAFNPHSRVQEDSGDDSLGNSTVLLNSLIESCQSRRMWVYQIRANLETAQSEGSSSQSVSPPSSDESSYDTYHQYDDEDNDSTSSRWARRKRGFKLRLGGISPKTKRIISTQSECVGQPAEPYSPPSPEDILSMYEKIIESRLESCQRINKMIHSANRATLHNR